MKNVTIRGVVFSALFAALTVVLSFFQIHLGFSPVPITLGNLAVMLAGAILGPTYGFFSILLVVFLTAIGLPLLDGSGGMSVILGPSGGYVWMWPFDALLTGLFVTRIKGNGVWAFVQAVVWTMIFGSLLCYVTGVPWLGHVMGWSLSKSMYYGCYLYLPGDALKVIVTALIVLPLRSVYPPSRLVGNQTGVVRLAD